MSSIRIPLSLRSSAVLGPIAAAMLVAPAAAADAPEIVVNGIRAPAANPNADPVAPYKVDRSASGKFSEPIADTPKSIVIIPKEVIEDLGATSIRDLVRTQPGVTLGTGEGGNAFGDRIFIRGFDARNDVYIDGLRDPGVTSREIFAIEQIEIIKGPSSTFGGRGTTGGAVSLISKAPGKSDFALLEAAGGSDATRRFTADVNRKLSETVQLRVNGLFHDGDTAGRDTVFNRRWGVAGAIAWQPAPSVDVIADYYHLTANGLPDWGVPFDVRSQQPFKVDRGNFYGVSARDFSYGRIDIGTVRLNWRLSDTVRLTSKSRYGSNTNSYIASAPESPVITDPDPANWTVRANPKNRNATSENYANATDLALEFDTGRFHHSVVTGVEFAHEEIVNRPYAFANSEAEGAVIVPPVIILQNLLNPNPNVPWTLFRALSGASTRTKVATKAVYAVDTIDLTPTIKLSGGLRYDDYRITNRAISAANVVTDLRNDSDFLNWNAGLVWKPVPKATLYVSASTSSNPSGEQTDGNGVTYGGLAGVTANLDPETNRSYEAGAKYQAGEGGHLLLTTAVFRTDKTNARVTDPVSGGSQILGGKQRVDGFEIGAQGNLLPGLSLLGGYTYLDAKVRATPTQPGGVFPNIPEHSFAMLTTYQVTNGITVGGQANYNSARFGGSTIGGTANVPGYWRFDATARVKVATRAEVQLNLLNLTDKTYYDAIYRSSTPFAYVAPGRSVLATLRISL